MFLLKKNRIFQGLILGEEFRSKKNPRKRGFKDF